MAFVINKRITFPSIISVLPLALVYYYYFVWQIFRLIAHSLFTIMGPCCTNLYRNDSLLTVQLGHISGRSLLRSLNFKERKT